MKTYALVLLLIAAALATKGFDLSYFQGDVPQSAFTCLANSGFSFGIIQSQRSTGLANPYAPNVYRRAKKAGIANVDFYLFPSVKEDGATQARRNVQWLMSEGVLTNNMIWIDIEEKRLFHPTAAQNVQFLKDIIAEIDRLYKGCGKSSCVGIYANKNQWTQICGTNTEFSKYPLWYPHYDGIPSFSDWVAFGGWRYPAIKQYKGTTDMCGTQIDLNFY
ncbi:hypothetical protein RCL1_007554 [Eukaryota sp. TZLM3-RCL]